MGVDEICQEKSTKWEAKGDEILQDSWKSG